MTESIRLANRLAEMLSCSRRETELYIEGDWVSVAGKISMAQLPSGQWRYLPPEERL